MVVAVISLVAVIGALSVTGALAETAPGDWIIVVGWAKRAEGIVGTAAAGVAVGWADAELPDLPHPVTRINITASHIAAPALRITLASVAGSNNLI